MSGISVAGWLAAKTLHMASLPLHVGVPEVALRGRVIAIGAPSLGERSMQPSDHCREHASSAVRSP